VTSVSAQLSLTIHLELESQNKPSPSQQTSAASFIVKMPMLIVADIVVVVNCMFASVLYNAFLNLEKNWYSIVADIAVGRISSELCIEDHVREKINTLLRPNQQRAAALHVSSSTSCSKIQQSVVFMRCATIEKPR